MSLCDTLKKRFLIKMRESFHKASKLSIPTTFTGNIVPSINKASLEIKARNSHNAGAR
jgi:hypothetical protein